MEESWDKYCKNYTCEWISNNKDECIILGEVENAEEKVKISLGEYLVREKSFKKAAKSIGNFSRFVVISKRK